MTSSMLPLMTPPRPPAGDALAAAQGDARAQNNLAYLYFEGDGVPQDGARGLRLQLRAAQQGLALAQTNLAGRYQSGTRVSLDLAEAVRWYTAAAAQGDAKAQRALG